MLAHPCSERRALEVVRDADEIFAFAAEVQKLDNIDVPEPLESACVLFKLLLCRRINALDGKPAMFYFHPWEMDPQQPRVDGIGVKTRFRHYVNLNRMQSRISRLLADFRWDRADRVFLGGIQ